MPWEPFRQSAGFSAWRLLVVILLGLMGNAWAATVYWNPAVASTDGNLQTNWTANADGSGATGFVAGDTLSFNGSGARADQTCTLTAGLTCAAISFTGYTGAFADGGFTLTANGSVTFVSGMTLTATGTLAMNSGGTLTCDGKTLNNLSSTAGTLVWGDAIAIAGTLTKSSGTLNWNAKTATLSGAAKSHSLNGPSLSGLTGGMLTIASTASGSSMMWANDHLPNLTFNATCTFDAPNPSVRYVNGTATGGSFTIASGVILTLTANATIALPAVATFSGGAGSVITGAGYFAWESNATAFPSSTQFNCNVGLAGNTGTVAFSVPAGISFGSTLSTSNDNDSPTITFLGDVTTGGFFDLDTNYNSGTGSQSLVFTAGSTVTVAGNVIYDNPGGTGTHTVNSAANSFNLYATGNLDLSPTGGTLNVTTGAGTWRFGGLVNLTGADSFTATAGHVLEMTAATGGTYSLTSASKQLSTLTLSASNNVSLADAASVNALVLNTATAMTLSGASGITLRSGALTRNDVTGTEGIQTISAPIALGANAAWAINSSDGAVVVSGVISGAKTLTKSGAGTLELDAVNTYSGLTTISAGLVRGTGTIAGNVSVTGGSLGAGTASAKRTLTVSGTADLSSGGTMRIRVDGYTAGGTCDKLAVASTLTLGGTSNLTLDVASLASSGTVVIATCSNTPSAFASVTLVNNPNGITQSVSYGAGSVSITLTVPSAQTLYWHPQGASSDGNDVTNYTTNQAGTVRATQLTGLDTLRFNGSGTNPNNACTLTAGLTCAAIDFTSYTGAFTDAGFTLTVGGNVTLAAGMTFTATGTLALSTRTWNSYSVGIASGTPLAVVSDLTGLVTANLELYESTNNNGVTLGSQFSTYNAGPHTDSFNNLGAFWANGTGSIYPFIGKSNVARGADSGESNTPSPSGVFDLQLHPPNNAHYAVCAFVAPTAGAYSVSGLGVRRVSSSGASVQFFVLDQALASVTNLIATNNQAWVTSASSYSLGSLSAGNRAYFAVGNYDTYAFDSTEVSWRVSTGSTVTGAGKTFNNITMNGGRLTFGDAFTIGGTLAITAGDLNWNGKAVTCRGSLSLDGVATLSTAGSESLVLGGGAGTATLTYSASATAVSTQAAFANLALTVASNGVVQGSSGSQACGAVTMQSGGILRPGGSGSAAAMKTGACTLVSGSTLALDLGATTTAGTTYDQLQVGGALALGGATLSVSNLSSGLSAGTYIIATCTGTASGTMTVSMPAGFSAAISTATSGQVRLVVGLAPTAPTLLTPVDCPDAGAAGPAGDAIATYGRTLNRRPRLFFTVPSDADTAALHFQVYLDGTAGTVVVADSAVSTTGFSWFNGSAWVAFPAGGATTATGQVRYQPQADLATDAAAWWTARATDGGSGGPAAPVCRFVVASPPWTDPTLTASVTRVRKIHVDELRTETNYLRAFRGLSAVAWTDPSITANSTLIRVPHFTELRNGLAAVDAITGVGLTTWVDTLSAGTSLIKAAHLTELRTAVAGL